VTRYLLDTNIISNVTKPVPSESLVLWMRAQADEDLFISTFSIAELWRGVLEKPPGRKREKLERWFFGPEGPQTLFAGRILSFDEEAALIWGRLMADGTVSGQPRSALDMVVASIAEANHCVIVTNNEKHFRSVAQMVNTMQQSH